MARSGPTSRGRRCVPPAPGMRPRCTSGSPTCEPACMMRWWHASASSMPPPSAVPWMAATVGISLPSSCSMRSPSVGEVKCPPAANSAMSAPAGKVLPSPASTTADALSALARSSPSAMPLRAARPRLLTGGAATRSSATRLRRRYVAMLCSSSVNAPARPPRTASPPTSEHPSKRMHGFMLVKHKRVKPLNCSTTIAGIVASNSLNSSP